MIALVRRLLWISVLSSSFLINAVADALQDSIEAGTFRPLGAEA